MILLCFFFFFYLLQPTAAKNGQIQTQMLRICEVFDAIFISSPLNDLPALWEGLVSPGDSYLLREAGEHSCDSMLTSGRLLLGLNVSRSSVHYFYSPLLPDFFYSFWCCCVDVQNHRHV